MNLSLSPDGILYDCHFSYYLLEDHMIQSPKRVLKGKSSEASVYIYIYADVTTKYIYIGNIIIKSQQRHKKTGFRGKLGNSNHNLKNF